MPRISSGATRTLTTPSHAFRPTKQQGPTCCYAPRITALEDARAICEAVSKPVNVLVWPGMDMQAVIDAGAQRLSVGAQLYWVAIAAAADAAERLHDGDVEAFAARPNVNEWLG